MGEDARVAMGTFEQNGRSGGHAQAVLFKNGQQFILEATRKGNSRLKRYPLAKLKSNYKARYMFNRDTFWTLKGDDTTDYSNSLDEAQFLYTPNLENLRQTRPIVM